MYLVTFDPSSNDISSRYWCIPEEKEETFLEEGIKLIKELHGKLRTSSMDVLVGAAVKQLAIEGKCGIREVTRAEAKENKAQLWIDFVEKPVLDGQFIPAAFNKSIKTANGWLITGDDEQ